MTTPPTSSRRILRLGLLGLAVVAPLALGGYLGYRSLARSAERREALTLAEKGPPGEALPALHRCLERSPTDPELLRAVVTTMIRAGAAVSDVEPYADRWCAAAPTDATAFRTKMDLLLRLARPADAVVAGERALELDPGDDRTRATVAGLYLDLGRYDDAAREFSQLLTRAQLPRAYLLGGLARAELERGNIAQASRLLDELLATDPNATAAVILRGITHYRAAEPTQAVAVLRRVPNNLPLETREIVLYPLARALHDLGRTTEAERAFAELRAVQDARRFIRDAEQRPDDLTLQVRAGEALLAVGRPDDAHRLVSAAVARLGSNPDASAVLARCAAAPRTP